MSILILVIGDKLLTELTNYAKKLTKLKKQVLRNSA